MNKDAGDMPSGITPVPDPDASWQDITKFALSYNGYQRYAPEGGDSSRQAHMLGDFANAASDNWERNQSLPRTLHELRCALFYEQRRAGHGFPFDFEPWNEWNDPRSPYLSWITHVKALITRIKEEAGDSIPMAPDT